MCPLRPSRDQVGRSNVISLYPRQPWPLDLPLVVVSMDEDGTEGEDLDMGVVLYSCSFAVIFLMILSQVMVRHVRCALSIFHTIIPFGKIEVARRSARES